MQTLHARLILFFCDSKMILQGKCQPHNLLYSSETGGLLLEPGAVTSTSPVICFITAIWSSVWSRHFFSFFFFTIHNEAHMHLPWQHLEGERILFSTILVFYDWMLNTLEADHYNPHLPYNSYTQSVSGRNKCLCWSSHMLCYGRMRSCVTHNSFASYDGKVICACRANKADHQ